MNASYLWLRDFVPFDLSATGLGDLLTSRCATVDEVVPLRQDLSGIVIGRVVEAAPHPDSDHLWVTKVDAGLGVLHDVVCGASNVSVGTSYPFAAVGIVLPGGLKIEKRKIRGSVSEGMLCSARELGLGADHEGIMALETDAAPGSRFLDVLRVGDSRLLVDVLPNRPDLLSHEGLAREIAAATGVALSRPPIPGSARAGSGLVDAGNGHRATGTGKLAPGVEVRDAEGCPRYMSAVVRGVTVAPSPDWLASRIESVGGRSINNVVDVTNYMLHGFGQPMHAFDLERLSGNRVIVRRASPAEKLVTLDSVERTLDDSMTVIADAEKPQAIAGVIGGKGSEVNLGTTDILLEAAVFDAARVRATRTRLGISTDASYRFERGVDRTSVPDLLAYATEMLVSVAGGTSGEITDSSPGALAPRSVELRLSRVAHLLGQPVTREEIVSNLSAVGFWIVSGAGDRLEIGVPTFRPDVVGEIELIEEVARLHGYENFSSELRPFRPGTVPDAPMHLAAKRVRGACVAAGLLEARPMPFVRTGPDSHRVRNPLAEDEAYLRTSILDSLARRAEYNLAHTQRNVRLFEIGTVFLADRNADTGAPAEQTHSAAVVLGDRRPAHFTEPKPPHYDEWDAKGLAVLIGSAAFPGADITCVPAGGDLLWTVTANDRPAGSVRRLKLDAPVWAAAAFGIEVDMEALSDALTEPKPYMPVPAMPSMEVDLALVVPNSTPAAEVERAIRNAAGDLLESLALFDEFRGIGISEGMRSLAWRLTFRHPERTLREKEIQGRTAKILSALEAALGIRQRTS